jgi:hypothetical protein
MVAIVRRDYAGYREKAAAHETTLAALTDSIRLVVRDAADWNTECFPALRRWVGFFRDHHMVGPWQASPPSPADTVALAAQSAAPDSSQLPQIRLLGDSTVYIRLPTLDLAVKPWIDRAFSDHHNMLVTEPYMIVDVRGDGGGCNCSFEALLPLLYSRPVHTDGSDVWSSEANIAFWQHRLDQRLYSDADNAVIRNALTRMRAHPNHFVSLSPPATERRDTIYPEPRHIAILVDGECASACEALVLEGRQSDKVVILGKENTRGAIDYGDTRKVYLPGWRQMVIPTTRLRHSHFDFVGVAPDVRIPSDIEDQVDFAAHYLRSAP